MADEMGTKISQLPLGENLADSDIMYAVEGGISKKVEVGYLKEVFGGGSDVSITPTLQSGTKIADYVIDGTSGAMYVPTAPTALSELTDDSTHRVVTDAEKTTWNGKANASDIPTDADELDYDNTSSGLTATDVQSAIDELAQGSGDSQNTTKVTNDIVESYTVIEPYLYKKNTYIDANGDEATLDGYDLYKFPINNGDAIQFAWSASFWGDLAFNSSVFKILQTDDSYIAVVTGMNNANYYVPSVTDATNFPEAIFVGTTNYKAIMVCVKQGEEDKIKPLKNGTYPVLNQESVNVVRPIDTTNSIKTRYYINANNVFKAFASNSVYWTLVKKVKQGDKIEIRGTISGVSQAGNIRTTSNTVITIPNSQGVYTVTDNGIAFLYYNTSMTRNFKFYPIDSIVIEAKNVIGDGVTPYEGLSAVAFGTSLTYRAQTTGGYLQYLPSLSGMTIDNQGIGSSEIMDDMLAAIKSYSSYSSKRVCILEGFVNDWYYNGASLGAYTDNTESTVCGCVRSALNYMLSKNANMTIFLVLDHYGRNYNSLDCSSVAVRDGHTQYEFYEEVAKVAESLGVPVIKLYALSGISENTSQYLADNIHPTALGAEQTANVIWSQMKKLYPNLVTNA